MGLNSDAECIKEAKNLVNKRRVKEESYWNYTENSHANSNISKFLYQISIIIYQTLWHLIV